MTLRRQPSKGDREKLHYEREYGEMTGHAPKPVVAGVSQVYRNPLNEREEERRLAATHDPRRATACRLCGISVPPTEDTVAGWKCCPACRELLPGGLAAVLSELTGETVEPGQVVELTTRIPCDNPSRFVTGWPTEPGSATRWAHVDPTLPERGRAVLAELRVRGPRPNSTGRGCAWCGVRTSTTWTQAPWRWGKTKGAPQGALCADCLPWVQRSGAYSGHHWRGHLLAACVGMRRPAWSYDLGLLAFFESNPSDASGTPGRWEYLNATTRGLLRDRVIRDHPRLVTLTTQERRVHAVLSTMAAASQPVKRTPLADV